MIKRGILATSIAALLLVSGIASADGATGASTSTQAAAAQKTEARALPQASSVVGHAEGLTPRIPPPQAPRPPVALGHVYGTGGKQPHAPHR
jgi:hypothetical protein